MFEFYGHGGVGFIINVLTDNDNRANSDINLVAKKNSLKPAATNSVTFKFETKARLDVNTILDEDELMELCLENDVDDYLLYTVCDGSLTGPQSDGESSILVALDDMTSLRDGLREKGLEVNSRLARVPLEGTIEVGDQDFEQNMAAIGAFEALDDVDSIEHNMDLTSE